MQQAQTMRTSGRGRPRRFDVDEAVATAQALFQAHGYDLVSLQDLTTALAIKPPSFYAAFGSKAGLFERVLTRYAQSETVPFTQLLCEGKPVDEGLGAVLSTAAVVYARSPKTPGCLVLESMRANDPDIRAMAQAILEQTGSVVKTFVAQSHPDKAERLSDYLLVVMAGLSAAACAGFDESRLQSIAQLARAGVAAALTENADPGSVD